MSTDDKEIVFITGTDTNIGKTTVGLHLLKRWKGQGFSTAALKPVASGCEVTADGLRNSDAIQYQEIITEELHYEDINLIALREPIAPHIAAEQDNVSISVADLIEKSQPVLTCNADKTVIEGAGGWLVPLNERETFADYVVALGIPVILVVGIRLGCLNHALLTVQSIENSGVTLKGWIANCLNAENEVQTQNINALKSMLYSPCLKIVNYCEP